MEPGKAPAGVVRWAHLLLVALACSSEISAQGVPFQRGDANADSKFNITDPIFTLGYLFLGTPQTVECEDALDADDDGRLLLTDAVYTLSYLFLNGAPPLAPFPECGPDPTGDALPCASFASCTANVNRPPVVSAGPDQTITLPASASLGGSVSDDGLPGPPSVLTIAWSAVSGPGTVTFADASSRATTASFSAGGDYLLRLTASDGELSSSATVTITVNPAGGDGGLPPDPRTVAPPLPLTEVTDLAGATSFLYTGTDPIQTGMAQDAIEPHRAAVLRGRVADRDGAALPGVTIVILDHPELGRTLTRADGAFDIAVNGGGSLVICYGKDGFLPVHRSVENIPWNDFAFAPDVVMIGLDPIVTPIDLTAAMPIQVARGSVTTDSDGSRQATSLFRQGTQATMVLADGSTQPLSRLSIRATEYTVGSNGPAAMPAKLPPTSGYTYAVELSIDEAMAAGATTVRFSRPVPIYVENFIGFPVGSIVPVGVYDREKGAWMAQPNGRVVAIVGINRGLADLDVSGDGVADTGAMLSDLGIDDAEREQLATLYAPGTGLWRAAVSHFSPIDLNWPRNAPSSAISPRQAPPTPHDVHSPHGQAVHCGSIIRCESQTLGERIGLAGTRYHLVYSSAQVLGGRSRYHLEIPVTVGVAPPPSLGRIEIDVTIAGILFHQVYDPAPDLVFTVAWDGRDAYGRLVQGEQPYAVEIRYVYPGVYDAGVAVPLSFALASGVDFGFVGAPRTREGLEFVRFQRYTGRLGGWVLPPSELGGWSLSHHHHYDLHAQVLHLGTGEELRASTIGRVVSTLLDESVPGSSPDGEQQILAVTAGPDGSVYFADQGGARMRRIRPDATVEPFAGAGCTEGVTNCPGSTDEGIPATEAKMTTNSISVGPDGVYINDWTRIFSSDPNTPPTPLVRIRRIGRDGLINTVAGNGSVGSTGDGGPATEAALSPDQIVVSPDGSIYVAGGNRIRRVGPEGIIQTIAGTGVQGTSGDGGPATRATLESPRAIALAPDGSIIVGGGVSKPAVRRITPDGLIQTIAGAGGCPTVPCGDGGPASEARFFSIYDAAVAPDGSVFVIDLATLIRQIGPEGIINTVAGLREKTNSLAYFADYRQATATQLFPTRVAVAPDGALIVASNGYHFSCLGCPAETKVHRIRRLALPSVLATAELAVPSRDGHEIYVFTRGGRHLRTLNGLTNALIRQFEYDADGRLVSVKEATGDVDNVTTIERAENGSIAIVSPFGQRTQLARDAQGYLSAVTNPASETTQLVHDSGGLLTQLVDPRGGVHRFTYDSVGRLIRDESPDGGASTLAHTLEPRASTVTLTTAEGRITTYRTELLSTGDLRRVITRPSGAQMTILRQLGGTRTITTPDGTVETIVEGPDPRWGLLAPVRLSQTVRLPSGLTRTVTTDRQATLADPADPFALATLDEILMVNGRATLLSFTASTRTFLTTTPAGRQVAIILDEHGRVASRQVSGLEPVLTTYDACGRVAAVDQGGRTTSFGYGPDGFLASITDALGRTTTYGHDPAGRIVSQTRPDGTLVRFAYDRGGNLIRLTPPGRPDHTFDYTPLDLTASYGAPGAVVTDYSYNRDRQLTRVTRPDGKLVIHTHDAAGRRSGETIDTGTITAVHDAADRLTSLTAPGGLGLTLSYDGFVATTEINTGAARGTVGRTVDPSFRLISRSLNGDPIDQSHDGDDLLTGVGDLTLERDSNTGLVSNMTIGAVATHLFRNGLGEVTGMQAIASFAEIYKAVYQRDALGRLTRVDDIGGTEQYTYDPTGRLVEVVRNNTVAERYGYDGNGNRTRVTIGGQAMVATHDNQDRLLTQGDATFTHTAGGERLTRTVGGLTTTYAYDALGNLVGVTQPDGTQITYLVDGQNRRVGKRVNGDLVQGFVYQDQLRPIAELDENGGVVSRFAYATNINVPAYMIRGGVTYRILTDQRGSPRLVVDAATGAVLQRMDYDAFGNVVQDTNPGLQPFGFAGGLYDRDTKLVRFGARDYDAQTGRWTAKDPTLFEGRDANLYAYVGNDPINRMDPAGTAPPDLTGLPPLDSGVNVEVGVGEIVIEEPHEEQGSDPTASPPLEPENNVEFGVGEIVIEGETPDLTGLPPLEPELFDVEVDVGDITIEPPCP